MHYEGITIEPRIVVDDHELSQMYLECNSNVSRTHHHQRSRMHHSWITTYHECVANAPPIATNTPTVPNVLMHQSCICHTSIMRRQLSRMHHERSRTPHELRRMCITNTSRVHHDCGRATTTVVGVKTSVISGKIYHSGLELTRILHTFHKRDHSSLVRQNPTKHSSRTAKKIAKSNWYMAWNRRSRILRTIPCLPIPGGSDEIRHASKFIESRTNLQSDAIIRGN